MSDPGGVRIPGVTLKVREISTGRTLEVTTNREGAFRLPEVPPGTYAVDVRHPDFAPYRHSGVTIRLGSTVQLDIVLQVQGGDHVAATAQPPAMDPAQTSMTSGFDTERIEGLPVQSRNYLDFVLLAPGVVSSAQAGARPATAAQVDSGFSFGGLRGRSNNLVIDGLDNNDEYAGAIRAELSLETVREFQVVSAGRTAQTGGPSGGSINVVTHTGTNALHGDAFLFGQNGALNAREPFEAERQRPNLHRYRFGLALGGPIVTDKTFYYAAFEQEQSRSQVGSFVSPAVVSAIDQYLANGTAPLVGVLTTRRLSDDPFPAARADTEALFKVNHQLTNRNSLMARYTFSNNRESGDAFNTGGLTDPSAAGSSFTEDQALVGSWTTIYAPRSAGEFRFQVADRNVVLRTNDALGRGVDIPGVVSFGRPYEGNGRRTEDHYEAMYTYSYSIGHHLVKAGATVNHVSLDAAMADGFGGLLTFGSLTDFLFVGAQSFRQAQGTVQTNFAVTNYGGFVQDRWSVGRKLTLDMGLRYDYESLPGVFHADRDNMSPRVGLAYHAAPDWVLRAGSGIFFDRYLLAALNRVLQKNGVTGWEQVLHTGLIEAPAVYTADKGMATPYSEQTSFSVEHLLAPNLTATASYLFVRGVKLPHTRNINTLEPFFHDIYQLEDSASSTYQGGSITLNRRMSDEFTCSASYTFSKTYDDASDFTEQPQNPFNMKAERAVSLQDQRHRLVFNALWTLPMGDTQSGKPLRNDWAAKIFGHIEVAPIVTVESGRPVNPLTGVDTYHTYAFPLSARPPGLGRNSLRTPPQADMDFRVLKFFPIGKSLRLDLMGEAFNLWNRVNVTQINAVFGSGPVAQPGYMAPIAGAGARRVQFSAAVKF